MSDLYAKRGVSAQKEDVHHAIKNLDKGLYPNAFCKIMPDNITGSEEHACIMHADTAGTKSILAYMYWRETGDLSVWKGIAQDAIVMNIDDMICAGATNHFVLSSTIARNKNRIPKEVLAAIIQGCDVLISEWKKFGIDIHMAGGETADVGDLISTIDVGYTAFARLQRSQVVTINPQPGNVIVGLASYGQATYETEYNSGIGCNGLTSARHDLLQKSYATEFPESYDQSLPPEVVYVGKYRLTDTTPHGLNIGKLLLSPTRTFAPLIKPIVDEWGHKLNGIVHNTGGAHTKCLKYIQQPVGIIKNNLLPTPPIFKLIQEATHVSYHEMYQVFNMGTRMEIYTDESTAQEIIKAAQFFHIDAAIIGHVESSSQKHVKIISTEGEYLYH